MASAAGTSAKGTTESTGTEGMPSFGKLTIGELKAILREAAIDMSLWGTANAKAVSHLLGEIRAHESVLRKLSNGGGVRRGEVELVGMVRVTSTSPQT